MSALGLTLKTKCWYSMCRILRGHFSSPFPRLPGCCRLPKWAGWQWIPEQVATGKERCWLTFSWSYILALWLYLIFLLCFDETKRIIKFSPLKCFRPSGYSPRWTPRIPLLRYGAGFAGVGRKKMPVCRMKMPENAGLSILIRIFEVWIIKDHWLYMLFSGRWSVPCCSWMLSWTGEPTAPETSGSSMAIRGYVMFRYFISIILCWFRCW